MLPQILVNGRLQDQITVQDRGFQYGDGLFETLRIENSVPLHWARHMRRLLDGCRQLGIPMPDRDLLEGEAQQLCQGAEQAVLKIMITRGLGARGYRQPLTILPTRVLSVSEKPGALDTSRGVRVKVCESRLGLNPSLAGIKHLNRLEQIVARAEWNDVDFAEGLMLDINDYVIEGTMSNLFFVKQGQLHTPDISQCGVAGITRERVLEISEADGKPAHIGQYSLNDILDADEVFLCNSLIQLWPVCQVSQRHYTDWPVSASIAQQLEQRDA